MLSLDSGKAMCTHQAKSALDLWALNVNISIHKMEQLTLSFQTLIQLIQTTLRHYSLCILVITIAKYQVHQGF